MNLSAFQIPQHLRGMVFLCPKDDPSRTGTISRMLGFRAGHIFITDSYKRLNSRLIRLD